VRCAWLEPDAGQTDEGFYARNLFPAFQQVIPAFLFLLSAKSSKVLQPQNYIKNANIISEATKAFFNEPSASGADFSRL
jgi:hypothetical protein